MPHDGLFSWGLVLKAGGGLMVLLLVVALRVLRGRPSVPRAWEEDAREPEEEGGELSSAAPAGPRFPGPRR